MSTRTDTATIAKLSKRVHDVTRALGGMRAALDTQIEEMQHVEDRLTAMAKATATSAERQRRNREGVEVCECCGVDVPLDEVWSDSDGDIALCTPCFDAMEDTHAPA